MKAIKRSQKRITVKNIMEVYRAIGAQPLQPPNDSHEMLEDANGVLKITPRAAFVVASGLISLRRLKKLMAEDPLAFSRMWFDEKLGFDDAYWEGYHVGLIDKEPHIWTSLDSCNTNDLVELSSVARREIERLVIRDVRTQNTQYLQGFNDGQKLAKKLGWELDKE